MKAFVNIEPSLDGAPRFRIEIDEVKKRELDGFSGVVARFLGQYFDELVTQLASGRASRLNNRLNDEIKKRVTLFKEYGVFRAIDYRSTEVVLHFDVSRFRSEGIAGYVFSVEQPGTVPFIGGYIRGMAPITTRSAQRPGPAQFGQRWHFVLRLRPPCRGNSPAFPLANRRDDFYTTWRTAKTPAGRLSAM